MLDNLRFDDESPIKFEHILEKDKYWLCINCNKKISIESIYCDNCESFRPFEMFKNIIHNPMNVTNDELELVNQRRKKEKQLVLQKDLESKDDKYWFMISSDWLYHWKCFISNKVSAGHD